MPKALKDIIYQVIEAYYEFEKENRIKINKRADKEYGYACRCIHTYIRI